MNYKLIFFLKETFKNNLGASSKLIQDLQQNFGFEMPIGYIDFMNEFNGLEGVVGENGWILLFPVDELAEINEDYSYLMNEIPEYFLIGKDAADTGFAFHKTNQTFHSFGLMSDFETDHIKFCGNSFYEFIEYLFNQE